MRIVHFSDFHLEAKDRIRYSQNLTRRLINKLSEINSNKRIDLIVFSGDLIDKGGASFDSLPLAFRNFENLIIHPILDQLHLSKERFVFVPGNHDVDRNKIDIYAEKGLKSDLTSEAEIQSFQQNTKNERHLERIQDFKDFEKEYYSDLTGGTYKFSLYQSSLVLNIDEVSLGIGLLNTAWRCNDSKTDKDFLILGRDQIVSVKDDISKCDLRIAVLHHSLNEMHQCERKTLKQLAAGIFDIVFSGHEHSQECSIVCQPEGTTLYLTTPGCLRANVIPEKESYQNGFMLVDVDVKTKQIEVSIFKQKEDEDFYIDNNFAGDSAIWSRRLTDTLPLHIERYNYLIALAEDNQEELNKHLLTYKSNSLAPKSIDALFVMPELTIRKGTTNEIDNIEYERYNDIDSILDDKLNLVFFGEKESGKTILLDKI